MDFLAIAGTYFLGVMVGIICCVTSRERQEREARMAEIEKRLRRAEIEKHLGMEKAP